MFRQAIGESFRRGCVRIVQGDRSYALGGERRGDRRPDAAGADDEAARTGKPHSLPGEPAREARPVEHVGENGTIGTLEQRVGGPGDLDGRRHLVGESHRRDLVRHRDQRAADVREPEDRLQESGVVVGTAAHRHDDGVDPLDVEPRVVDERRLERFGRIADVRNERRLPADHGGTSFPLRSRDDAARPGRLGDRLGHPQVL